MHKGQFKMYIFGLVSNRKLPSEYFQAPLDTKLQIPEPSEGIQLLMKSTRGPIECYLCPETDLESENSDQSNLPTSRHALNRFLTEIFLFPSQKQIFDAKYSRDHDNNESADSRTSNQSKFLPFSPLSEQGLFIRESCAHLP